MFNGLEKFRPHRIQIEHLPEITDPYRQIRELVFHPTYQGTSTFMGYEHPQLAQHEWKVVPISTPDQLLKGLKNLISVTEMDNTEVLHRRFLTKGPSTYLHKDAYKDDLEKMYKKIYWYTQRHSQNMQ